LGYSDELDEQQQTSLTPMKSARQILLGGMLAAAVMAAAPSARAQVQTTARPVHPARRQRPNFNDSAHPPILLRKAGTADGVLAPEG